MIDVEAARRLQVALKNYHRAEEDLRTHELDNERVIEFAQKYEAARQELKGAKEGVEA